MSDGFVKWYRTGSTGVEFCEQVTVFSQFGISLLRPNGWTVALLDVDGNSVEVEQAELVRIIERRVGRSFTYQWWLDGDIDLTCEISFMPGGNEVQTFYLDGLVQDESDIVIECLRKALERFPAPSKGLVYDATGVTEEFDWDDFMLYGGVLPDKLPDLLVLEADAGRRFFDIDILGDHAGRPQRFGDKFISLAP